MKPSEVQSLFDRVAPAYDLLNRVLSMRRDVFWREAAARLARPEVDGPLLDLACGTFDLSRELSRQYPDRLVAGADFSLEMLRRGRKKVALWPGIAATAGDGCRLPFADRSFAAATCAFGIRNMPDRAAALAELARVIKPGGRLVILEFGRPSGLFGWIYKTYLLGLLPRVARALSPDPEAYVYLGQSILDFPSPDRFMDLMTEAGFRPRVLPLNRGICNAFHGERV